MLSSLEQALKDISDPLISTRAHGLISLRSLILKKDQATLSKMEEVLNIFKKSLSNEDE